MDSNRRVVVVALLAIASVACSERTLAPADDFEAAFATTSGPSLDALTIQQGLDNLNGQLAAGGAAMRVARVELSLAPTADPASPIIVFASDHTHHLTSRWVPADPRRNAAGTDITFANFFGFLNASGAGAVEASLDAGFATWNSQRCSGMNLQKIALSPTNFPSAILGLGAPFTSDPFEADISTIGFLPGAIFDVVLGPGASGNVLGVTFTFIWIDGNGDPTDINGDHRNDTALKEIWYNNAFLWSTNGGAGVDVESVALHEEGHALELGHFGRVAGNTKTGKLTVSPRAVMNAFILGVLRSPLGTDRASYCGNFASWPH